ncbi:MULTISPECIES: potassium/proton antiporter [Campylobacter]|uniref:Potassium/proton antiporter n=1 Tax=Campylobacter californiensis TaxID=1032243 RepID=A0ABD4JFU3_9BACT|nr:potassium/proton antiporter [Campylobacter sp. RM12916]MBE2985652.1 potassium/proton antiporter [Campylobacter sp. RM12919]MBE2987319.1 potassium/proton antiporter [Campylobacter sp. RM12920]MBE3022218.1 potassium/proton antiporter [Campylobacter sp. 7477a]MBE3609139.1 potassium/proton antiporter [Campylobacter sp. RM12916]
MENLLLFFAILLLASILISKISDKFGIPALLVFLGVGMLAGSEGLLGVHFDNQIIAQNVGMLALIFILYAGGLDTNFSSIKPVFSRGLTLATIGVILTAFAVAPMAKILLGFSWLESLLLGAVISSTDAAAVFAILRAKKISLKNNLAPLIEFESGSNDPMAIFLTMNIIQIISISQIPSPVDWLSVLGMQFGIGIALGYLFGLALPSIFNRLRLSNWGMYPVFSMAWILLLYTLCFKIGGNGYLAVYIAGIFINKRDFVHKKNLIGFHDGIAWAMQIVVFLTLGLLVFPSQLPEIALMAFVLSLWLTFIARPVGVFVSLIGSKFNFNEKLFVSWVGLRGVVPIILATYTYVENIPNANIIFNIVFFMVLTSICMQGMSIGYAATKFNVRLDEAQEENAKVENSPILTYALRQYTINLGAKVIGKNLAEVSLPSEFLIILVKRKNEYLKPTGSYIFNEGDLLLVQCENHALYQDTIKALVG